MICTTQRSPVVSRRSRRGAPLARARSGLPAADLARLTDDIIAALKTVYDPEIPS
jgi:hypothetical protein